jgi:hypothetical protein
VYGILIVGQIRPPHIRSHTQGDFEVDEDRVRQEESKLKGKKVML